MKLIIGLGNPGDKYSDTWHNVGFLAIDKAHENNFDNWQKSSKYKLVGARKDLDGQKIMLIKPQTFMNNSGQAVAVTANFYKVAPKDIMIIHDDIDIELGKVKKAFDSSSAGHNGIKSIIAELGTQKFHRLRIGIKSSKQGQVPTDKFVLQKMDKEDMIKIDEVITGLVKTLETSGWI